MQLDNLINLLIDVDDAKLALHIFKHFNKANRSSNFKFRLHDCFTAIWNEDHFYDSKNGLTTIQNDKRWDKITQDAMQEWDDNDDYYDVMYKQVIRYHYSIDGNAYEFEYHILCDYDDYVIDSYYDYYRNDGHNDIVNSNRNIWLEQQHRLTR